MATCYLRLDRRPPYRDGGGIGFDSIDEALDYTQVLARHFIARGEVRPGEVWTILDQNDQVIVRVRVSQDIKLQQN